MLFLTQICLPLHRAPSCIFTARPPSFPRRRRRRLPPQGGPYVDPRDVSKLLGRPSGKNLEPFRPSRGEIKPSGAGSTFGLFGEVNFDTTPTHYVPDAPKEKVEIPKRAIYTAGPKRGGPGYPDHANTISGTSFAYTGEEYGRAEQLDRELKAAARARIKAPFVAMNNKPVYSYLPDTAPTGSAAGGGSTGASRSRPNTAASSSGRPAWRPNNPPPRGTLHSSFTPVGTLSGAGYKDPGLPAKWKGKNFAVGTSPYKRLSMWTPSPFSGPPRPSKDVDLLAINAGPHERPPRPVTAPTL